MFVSSLITIECRADEGDNTQISFRRSHPIGGAIPPSKAPGKNQISLCATYNSCNSELCFYDEEDDAVSFFIYSSDSICVSQGVCDFDENHSYATTLSLMPGSYTIVVFINDLEYVGTIDVED